MSENTLNVYGITLTRVTLGVVLIAHSLYLKLVVFTLAGTAQFFASLGLPPDLAYVVFTSEALAGIALVLGVETRWAALAIVPVLAGATWAHFPAGWLFTNANGGWEYPAFLTFAALGQSLLGDGALALRRSSRLGLLRAGTPSPVAA